MTTTLSPIQRSVILLSVFTSIVYLGFILLSQGGNLEKDPEDDDERKQNRRDGRLSRAPVIEVCLSDYESAKLAAEGGATSVELCANRMEGGVTPSLGLVKHCARTLDGVEVHVLIRPRPGGFCYTTNEFDLIQRDIIAARAAGADGIVFGALTHSGEIDLTKMRTVRMLTADLTLTFHRAFDLLPNPVESLELLVSLGVDRVLTSGSSASASEGKTTLYNLVQAAKGKEIQIIAAAGISPDNVEDIIGTTQCHGVHAGQSLTKKVDLTAEQQELFKNLSLASKTHDSLGGESIHPKAQKQKQLSTPNTQNTVSADLFFWDTVDQDKLSLLVSRSTQLWNILTPNGGSHATANAANGGGGNGNETPSRKRTKSRDEYMVI